MRAPVFPRVCDYRIHLVVRAIPLTLKLLEFLRCDVPVSSTLALSKHAPRALSVVVCPKGCYLSIFFMDLTEQFDYIIICLID